MVGCVDLRRWMINEIDVSTFEDRCVDLWKSMCRPSKIDDRCVDVSRSMINVPTFENRCVRPLKIDDRCENYVAALAQNIDIISATACI